MVDLSDFLDPGEDEPVDPVEEAADLAALKACLQALADAVASTNLAVIKGSQGDVAAAGSRVQASVGALKRFHEAFTVLKGDDDESADPGSPGR